MDKQNITYITYKIRLLLLINQFDYNFNLKIFFYINQPITLPITVCRQ